MFTLTLFPLTILLHTYTLQSVPPPSLPIQVQYDTTATNNNNKSNNNTTKGENILTAFFVPPPPPPPKKKRKKEEKQTLMEVGLSNKRFTFCFELFCRVRLDCITFFNILAFKD